MDTIIGFALGIPIYSNKSGAVGNTPYGIKYECVEFVRRWYAHVFEHTFEDIKNAVDIFTLRYSTSMKTNKAHPFVRFLNDGQELPEIGDILVWQGVPGHVAIVSHVSFSSVTVAEQNYSETGYYTLSVVNNQILDKNILGWMRL